MGLNADLLTRRERAVPRGLSTAFPVFAARAENAEVWDVEERRFIDSAGGIAVLNVGHRHPRVLAAVQKQLELYTNTSFQIVPYEPYIALAERLNALAPFTGPAKTILFSTGAEATENAVKIARAAADRSAVIAFTGGFHGRTMLSMAMTGKVLPYRRKFGPMPDEVFHAPFPVDHHGTCEPDAEATRRVTAAALKEGLILLSCGVFANAITVLVPLTASDAVLDEGLDKLETALSAARG